MRTSAATLAGTSKRHPHQQPKGGFILTGIAYAMGQGGAAAGQGAGGFGGLIPIILMFVIFYFLLIRPQQKRNKEHKEMITNLKKGDRVVTSGGIYGRITGLDEATITMEIADKVRVKVVRSNVSALAQSAAPQTAPPKKEKTKGNADKS
jgi:preprotein translocase subunit YajC